MRFRFAPFALLLSAVLSLPASARQDRVPDTAMRTRLAEFYRMGRDLGPSIWKGLEATPYCIVLVAPPVEYLLWHGEATPDFALSEYDDTLQTQILERSATLDQDQLSTLPAVNGYPTIELGMRSAAASLRPTAFVLALLGQHVRQMLMSAPGPMYYRVLDTLGLADKDWSDAWRIAYPFPYDSAAIGESLRALGVQLATALHASDSVSCDEAAHKFRTLRAEFLATLSENDAKFFAIEEWLGGLPLYSQLQFAKRANEVSPPSRAFVALEGFTSYAAEADSLRRRIVGEIGSLSLKREGRDAFARLGAAEAILLSRVRPEWTSRVMTDQFSMDKYFDPEKASAQGR